MPSTTRSLKSTIAKLKQEVASLTSECELRKQESQEVRNENDNLKEENGILRANFSNQERAIREMTVDNGELQEKLNATNKVLEESLAVIAKQTGKMTELRIKMHMLADGQDIDGDVKPIRSYNFFTTLNVKSTGQTRGRAPLIKITDCETHEPTREEAK